jgi:hypothetical protein
VPLTSARAALSPALAPALWASARRRGGRRGRRERRRGRQSVELGQRTDLRRRRAGLPCGAGGRGGPRAISGLARWRGGSAAARLAAPVPRRVSAGVFDECRSAHQAQEARVAERRERGRVDRAGRHRSSRDLIRPAREGGEGGGLRRTTTACRPFCCTCCAAAPPRHVQPGKLASVRRLHAQRGHPSLRTTSRLRPPRPPHRAAPQQIGRDRTRSLDRLCRPCLRLRPCLCLGLNFALGSLGLVLQAAPCAALIREGVRGREKGDEGARGTPRPLHKTR